jgi:hypothetical protein
MYKTGKGNLLELAVEAARYRTTLGEIRMPGNSFVDIKHKLNLQWRV